MKVNRYFDKDFEWTFFVYQNSIVNNRLLSCPTVTYFDCTCVEIDPLIRNFVNYVEVDATKSCRKHMLIHVKTCSLTFLFHYNNFNIDRLVNLEWKQKSTESCLYKTQNGIYSKSFQALKYITKALARIFIGHIQKAADSNPTKPVLIDYIFRLMEAMRN